MLNQSSCCCNYSTEIKRYKKRIDDADTQRQCLEEKVQYLRMQAKEAEDAKAQVTSLRTKLDRLQRYMPCSLLLPDCKKYLGGIVQVFVFLIEWTPLSMAMWVMYKKFWTPQHFLMKECAVLHYLHLV